MVIMVKLEDRRVARHVGARREVREVRPQPDVEIERVRARILGQGGADTPGYGDSGLGPGRGLHGGFLGTYPLVFKTQR